MTLKPSMTLKMGQQLRMTPQLQQAIRLLQLSSADLELEIREALDSNLMLEEIDEEAEPESPDLGGDEPADVEPGEEAPTDPELDGDAVPDTSTELKGESIVEELPVDTSWDDVYGENPFASGAPDDYYPEARKAEDVTIQSHLSEQLNLLNLTQTDRCIAAVILDGLDEDGVLRIEISDILDAAPGAWQVDEVEAVLHLVQHLDPLGVAARSLGECLCIQLRQLPRDTPCRDTAITLVEQHLDLLATRNYAQIERRLRIREAELKQTMSLIQSLNPRPGSAIGSDKTDYVEPDVIVSRQNGGWLVELNPKSTPRVRVNPEYAALVGRGGDDAGRLKHHLQEAKWFIKSLQQRNDTLLRVASRIVEYQRDFLERGEQAMKPLVLHDIAEAVGLHESTISRVTTRKYMLTPSGVYELKYFFSSHVSTGSGGEVSSTAIRALIKQLVAGENPRKPLSDSKIAGLLARQNINVARRTIAKYRETLAIPPSNERKQLI